MNVTGADTQAPAAALPHLRCLTHLHTLLYCAPPATMTDLTSLRSLLWEVEEEEEDNAVPRGLPPGLWISCLERCGASGDLVALSLPALSAATSLRELGFWADACKEAAERVRRITKWVGGHASLQRLRCKVRDFLSRSPEL
ncbi:hypothetical protein ABPG75_013729 [Micractinium tetrahymenae]